MLWHPHVTRDGQREQYATSVIKILRELGEHLAGRSRVK